MKWTYRRDQSWIICEVGPVAGGFELRVLGTYGACHVERSRRSKPLLISQHDLERLLIALGWALHEFRQTPILDDHFAAVPRRRRLKSALAEASHMH
jgi:hypothetical protein